MGKKINRSPSRMQWTHSQYGRGAARSLAVVAKTIRTLDLNREEILLFLDSLSESMYEEAREHKRGFHLKSPFIDRNVNRILLVMQDKEKER